VVADIRRTRTVSAEAQQIWDLLADFDAISSWADNVDHSCLLSAAANGVAVDTTRRVQIGRDTPVEPHGAALANAGVRRDRLIADRVVWLTDRYARRRAGDQAALRPFLLVASFVNPHDIVLFPAWARRSPLKPSPLDPPPVPAHTASNFEGLIVRVDEASAPGGGGHLWKLVRTFDDPATWTEPGVRHLAANGLGGEAYRTSPLDDQWELYDLTVDPIETDNRWADPGLHELRQHLRMQLKQARAASVPERNQPWPYAVRRPPTVRRLFGRS
jgi:hypothetical protein